jgi:YbbR domain-containing protein
MATQTSAEPASGGTQRLPPSWRRRLTEAFSERLALKGTALLLAVVLWFIVTAKEPNQDLVEVQFAPQLDSSLVLKDPPPPIHALVVGTPQELLKLFAHPLVIRRQISANSPDTVVVDLSTSDVELPPGVDAIVRGIEPHSVTLRFESTSSRMVPVRSAVQVIGDSLHPTPPPMTVRLEPEKVEVSGPRQRVLATQYVTTTRVTIPATDSLPHLVDIDTTRLGLRVKPSQVKVHLVPSLDAPAAATVAKPEARR